MKKLNKYLFGFLFFLPTVLCAQLTPEQESQIDSIKHVIKTAKYDSVIIKSLTTWDKIIYITDPELDLQLNKKIDSLCSVNLKKKTLKENKVFFQKSKAFALNNIGIIEVDKGEYAKAIENFTQSLQLREEIGDQRGIASALNNIANIYVDQEDYEKAIDYYTQSIQLRKKIGDQQGVASSLNNIGGIYADQEDYKKAIDYHTQSLQLRKEIGDQQGVATSLNNLGVSYQGQHNLGKAIEYYTQSLQLREEIGDQQGVASSLNNIGNIYTEKENYLKALDYSSRALQLAQELGTAIETRSATKSLWKVNKKLGRYRQSLEAYEHYIQIRDSIQSKENEKEVIRQEYKYEYEKQSAADSVAFAKEQEIRDIEIARQQAEIKMRQNQQYALFLGLFLVLVFAGLMYNRFRLTRKQKGIIEKQKEEVEEAHGEIRDSINYAKRIQKAILPPQSLVKSYLKNSFILYKPKDIVAGDFYWMEHVGDNILFAAADCTGHGVPGAMVSVVCNNGLNRAVREYSLRKPDKILNKTREIVVQEFEKAEEAVKDGMDISICSLSLTTLSLSWAGANNPLWVIRKDSNQVEEIKADKQPIGKYENPKPYTKHELKLQEGDSIYIFTDGFQDQFGGDMNKKFKSGNFKKLLLQIQDKPMEDQKQIIDNAFEDWKGGFEQVDDVCVIGVRI